MLWDVDVDGFTQHSPDNSVIDKVAADVEGTVAMLNPFFLFTRAAGFDVLDNHSTGELFIHSNARIVESQ